MHHLVSKYHRLEIPNFKISKFILLPLFLIGVMITSISTPATASQKRVALVMGISNYNHASQLPNPVQDATKLASVLSSLGFDVTLRTNLGINDMRNEVRTFAP